jgi:hypothetical protein
MKPFLQIEFCSKIEQEVTGTSVAAKKFVKNDGGMNLKNKLAVGKFREFQEEKIKETSCTGEYISKEY